MEMETIIIGDPTEQEKEEKTNWTAKPFFKKGLMILNGPLEIGKASLCANLALANSQKKELWPGGPKGDGRDSFFLNGGLIEKEHIFCKLRLSKGPRFNFVKSNPFPDDNFEGDVDDRFEGDFDYFDDDGNFFNSKIFVNDLLETCPTRDHLLDRLNNNKNIPLILKNILKLVHLHKPAFAFFCLKHILRYERSKNITKILNDFMAEVKNIDTTIIGLTTTIAKLTELKNLPILNIKKTGEDRFLIKKSGFSDSPHGVLRFKIEHKEDHFSACGLEYLENLTQVKSRRESQDALFREIVAQLIAKGQPIFTAELKAMARKAGISSYFWANIHWLDYGLIAKGQGFGGNYRQVLVPIERH